jgi:alpha-L-fucosidase
MFIHFGLYAAPARHEWIQSRERIQPEDYKKYFDHFDPDLFDAKEWAKKAKAAGMKYAVLTAKHHEGFCLFDTKYTDYKITNTEFGRDIVKEYVEAFRAEGLKVGLYYSLIDWHHPEFTLDTLHPLTICKDAEEINAKRDMKIYAEYMRNQVTELLTNYGKIDILWFDFSYKAKRPYYEAYYHPWMKDKDKEAWESEKLIATARALQPEIIIDNRADIEQDLWTPEQVQPEEWVKHKETGELVTWEACQTFSGSWGYYRDEQTWKSPHQLIGMLVKTVALGGNLLMNVGPTARGYFDARADKALEEFGEWMRYNSRSIYGCTMAEPEFVAPNGCRLTQTEDGKRLYIHLLEYPYPSLKMPCLEGKIEYAQFLHDASEIKFRKVVEGVEDANANSFILPTIKPNVVVPVIEVFLK